MEFGLGVIRSGLEGRRIKQEKRSEESDGRDEDDVHPKEQDNNLVQVPSMEDTTGPTASSTKKEEAEKLECAKAEMGEAKEENERLKQHLERVLKDYRSLQMQFQDIVQKEPKHMNMITSEESNKFDDDLVSLSLGRSSSSSSIIPPRNNKIEEYNKEEADNDGDDDDELALGLDCKFQTNNNELLTTRNSSTSDEPSNNNKDVKRVVRDGGEDNHEVSQHNNNNSPPKKPRVCVRTRCDTPTMNDGCQWRKYGQKIAKGNPCPRAYYRCTVAPSCPVRKQVQRCAEDMSILLTTYEGNHNHPLPLSATAMASTTSAAASMLVSGSLPPSSSSAAATTCTTDLRGLNFYLSNNNNNNNNNPTLSSSSHSHPTITLDLTTTSPSSRIFHPSNYYNPPTSSSLLYPPSYSSTSLNFSHPRNYNNNNNNNNVSYQYYNHNHHVPNYNYMQKNSSSTIVPPSSSSHDANLPAERIAAATKAITADPKFHSALAVALNSIFNGGAAENLGHAKIKWGDHLFPASSSL